MNVQKQESKNKELKQIFFIPKTKQTVNNMNINKFNNIFQPIINNNTNKNIPVNIVSGKVLFEARGKEKPVQIVSISNLGSVHKEQ